jgi:hypothetical protein
MQLDPDLTLKKATNMARQSESVRMSMPYRRRREIKGRDNRCRDQRSPSTNKKEQDVGDMDIARTIQETIAQQKE